MPVLEIEYKGSDIVIPKDTAEKELGLHIYCWYLPCAGTSFAYA